MSYKYPFLNVLAALGKGADKLVLVGGWVPTVYFEYLWQGRYILATMDVDLGIGATLHMNPLIERRAKRGFSKKHLKMGHENPYQLIYEGIPIDFLADKKALKKVKSQVLGNNIILNTNEGYDYLLTDTIKVTCSDIKLRTPDPARYITHKIFVYLSNHQERQRDIAVAYYCLSRSPKRDEIIQSIKKLKRTKVLQTIRKQLPAVAQSPRSAAIQDVRAVFRRAGREEPAEDVFTELQALMTE
jgi:hypothetical protein